MKSFGSILLIYIIGLIGMPILDLIQYDDNESCVTSCCHSDTEETPIDNEDNDCNGSCNPFFSCVCGIGFLIPQSNVLEQIEVFEEKQVLTQYHSTANQVVIPIWQPPKIA